jgi:hypothetical protein
VAGSETSKRTPLGESDCPAGVIEEVAGVLSAPQSSATRNISITPLAYSIVSLCPLTTFGSPTQGGWNEPAWKFPVAVL